MGDIEVIEGPHLIVPLSRGLSAIIDPEDAEAVLSHKWFAHHSGYAIAHIYKLGEQRTVQMHRLILDAHKGTTVDHINRNRLDNRRSNLRFANLSQQRWNSGPKASNSTGFKGVSWNKNARKFMVLIANMGKNRYLGYYDTAEEGAKVYDAEALRTWGEFAYQNFPRKTGE